jgi:hypothetical protein
MVIDGDQTDITAPAPADRRWRIKDRLTQSDLDQLVASFGQGTAIPELAERYASRRPSSATAEHDAARRTALQPELKRPSRITLAPASAESARCQDAGTLIARPHLPFRWLATNPGW